MVQMKANVKILPSNGKAIVKKRANQNIFFLQSEFYNNDKDRWHYEASYEYFISIVERFYYVVLKNKSN
jgi:hypothetical protein